MSAPEPIDTRVQARWFSARGSRRSTKVGAFVDFLKQKFKSTPGWTTNGAGIAIAAAHTVIEHAPEFFPIHQIYAVRARIAG
jgi:hypothetical protein